jgi:phosphatidylglycerol:prolipoprotein diacylglycerol transferase
MRRILLQWHGIRIYSYPAMLYLGIVLGVNSATFAARHHGLDPTLFHLAILFLLIPALVGARLLFVAVHWDIFRAEPGRIWRRSDGGAALYGGLILTLLLSFPLLNFMNISVAAFWDATAIAMLIGMIPTKFGCFLNGCCAGRTTRGRLAVYLPNELGEWAHRVPAQLLEAGLAALLLILSVAVWQRFPMDGVLFLTALGGYGIGRWWLESTREAIDSVGSLNLHKAISAALVLVSISSLTLIWFRSS